MENKRDTLVDQLSFNLNQDVVNTARKKEPEIREQEKPKFLTIESDDSEDNIQNEAVKQDSERNMLILISHVKMINISLLRPGNKMLLCSKH